MTLFRLLVLITCVAVVATPSFAQRARAKTSLAKISVRNIGFAKVSVSKGALTRTIDVSSEVAGCRYVSGPVKASLRKQGCAAPPATFKLIDATIYKGNAYLILLSEAMGNCNVCGRCGAAEAFSLVWVELDQTLRVRNKRSVAIQDCMTFTDIVEPQVFVADPDNLEALNLVLKDEVLRLTFETREWEEGGDNSKFVLSNLTYDRRHADQGFVISTEKRDKSAQKNP